MDKSLWTASLVLVIFGILFLGAGISCQIYQNYREPLKGRVTARVVELLLQEPPKRGDQPKLYKNCYYPVFEYYAEGKLYKVTYPHGSYPSTFQINQEVKLIYNKTDPLDYQIAQSSTLKILAEALYAAGVICIFAGCIIFVIFAVRG